MLTHWLLAATHWVKRFEGTDLFEEPGTLEDVAAQDAVCFGQSLKS